jgi:hypothetical protein
MYTKNVLDISSKQLLNNFFYIWHNIILEILDWINKSIKEINKGKNKKKRYYSKKIKKLVEIFTIENRILYSVFGVFIFFLVLKKIS